MVCPLGPHTGHFLDLPELPRQVHAPSDVASAFDARPSSLKRAAYCEYWPARDALWSRTTEARRIFAGSRNATTRESLAGEVRGLFCAEYGGII